MRKMTGRRGKYRMSGELIYGWERIGRGREFFFGGKEGVQIEGENKRERRKE